MAPNLSAGAGKRTWTFTKLPPLEPESSASANSAIPANGMSGCGGISPRIPAFILRVRINRTQLLYHKAKHLSRCFFAFFRKYLWNNIGKMKVRLPPVLRKKSRELLLPAFLVRKTGLELRTSGDQELQKWEWYFRRYSICLRSERAHFASKTANGGTGSARFVQKRTGRRLPTCSFWCGKRDLNPYGVNHTPLKRARLPVPPLPHSSFPDDFMIILQTYLFVNRFFKHIFIFWKYFYPEYSLKASAHVKMPRLFHSNYARLSTEYLLEYSLYLSL